MKRIRYFAALLAITTISVSAQDEEEGGSEVPYLSTTTNMVVAFPIASGGCFPSRMAFDFEPVNGDPNVDLDLVFGKTEYDGVVMNHQGRQRYNNGSGDFLNDDGTFLNITSFCPTDETINQIIFGKLRPTNARRDLAMLRQNEIRVYLNTGNGMATTPNQVISTGALGGAWAPFVAGDSYEDLVVYAGSQVRAYRNLTDGTLDVPPVSYSITATKIYAAQMDENIYKTDFDTRFDLVSYSGSQVSVRLNNNNNGFSSTQTFDVGFGITGLAIGDVNNDGFNDIVAAGDHVAKLYHNNNGTINEISVWSPTNLIAGNCIPLIGDMGTPSDANRNDGWNDILLTGYEAVVRIYANNNGTFSLTPQQSFISGPHFSVTNNAMLVDMQNTGGLSFAYQSIHSHITGPHIMIHTNKHTGNPAPAPPKNVGVVSVPRGYGGYYDAKVTWRANTERDLAGYELWRRVTGVCGNGTWFLLAEIDASETEYIDELGTVSQNGNCLAEYKLLAVDDANNESDFSQIVEIEFGSDIWKAAGGKPETKNVPSAYVLHPAFPNPFNPSTQFRFDLPEDSYVSLVVFDVLGRKVAEVASQNYVAGYHAITWTASTVSSGVYIARFTAIDATGSVKLSTMSKLVLTK